MAGQFKISDDYIDVAERIRELKEEFPLCSLQSRWCIQEVGDKTFVVCDALAYRTPDDTRPGQGLAWEPFPGPTPFTRDSELMNAQTSAWGRAIVALGFATKKIASRQEVENRSQEGLQRSGAAVRSGDRPDKAGVVEGAATVPATPAANNGKADDSLIKMRKKLDVMVGKLRPNVITTAYLYEGFGRTPVPDADGEIHWAPLRDSLTKKEASDLIDHLTSLEAEMLAEVPFE